MFMLKSALELAVFCSRFIQDWVFHGICRDAYGEFLISVSDEYLHYRGNSTSDCKQVVDHQDRHYSSYHLSYEVYNLNVAP